MSAVAQGQSPAQKPKQSKALLAIGSLLVVLAVVGVGMSIMDMTTTTSTTPNTTPQPTADNNAVKLTKPNKVEQFTAQVKERVMANKVVSAVIASVVLLLVIGAIVAAVWLSMQQVEQVVVDEEKPAEPVVVPQAPEPTLWERYFGLWIALIVVGSVILLAIIVFLVLLFTGWFGVEIDNPLGENDLFG